VEVSGGALDALNKVLSALLAASSSSSSSSNTQPQPVSEGLSPDSGSQGAAAGKKSSLLKVIDHQNQPAAAAATSTNRSSTGGGAGSESASGSRGHRHRLEDLDYRTIPVTSSISSTTSTTDGDYRQRLDQVARLVAYSGLRDMSDLHSWQHPDDGNAGRYVGRTTADGSGGDVIYRPLSGDVERYYPAGGAARQQERSSAFWNELSAYCDEYEARVGQRERDVVGASSSRLPRPPTVGETRIGQHDVGVSRLPRPPIVDYLGEARIGQRDDVAVSRLPRPPTVNYSSDARISQRSDVDSRQLRPPPTTGDYDQRRAGDDTSRLMSNQRRQTGGDDVLDSSRRGAGSAAGSAVKDVDERQARQLLQLYKELHRAKTSSNNT